VVVKSTIFWDITPWLLAKLIFSTLKMEAICSSETSVATQQTTRRHIPEDDTLHNHRCENLKSYKDWKEFIPYTVKRKAIPVTGHESP
jgi:hypothetical protein